MKRFISVLAACSWLYCIGCNYYTEALLEGKTRYDATIGDAFLSDSSSVRDMTAADTGAKDATAKADSSQNSDGSTSLVPLKPPNRPDAGQVDTDGGVELLVALSSIDFGEDNDPKERGFDIDDCCTCQENDPCKNSGKCIEYSSNADSPTQPICDGPRCQDNATGLLLQRISDLGVFTAGTFGSQLWTEDIKRGRWSVIIRVLNYNEKPDDPHVTVKWYLTGPFDIITGNHSKPKWNGTDIWPIVNSCLKKSTSDAGPVYDIDDPVFSDTRAYVTNYKLVASFAKLEIKFSENYDANLSRAIIVADLIKDHRFGWTIKDIELSALWDTDILLRQLARLKNKDTALCASNLPIDSWLKVNICPAMDSTIIQPTPTTPCSALSVGAHLSTVPAQLGSIVSPPEYEDPCTQESLEKFTCKAK